MKNTEHTPGPWIINQTTDRWAVYGRQHTVMVVADRGLIPMPQDARLIAAAPDMLAALRDAEELLVHESTQFVFKKWEPVFSAIQKAITKASGEL